jgi:hypothetical protein
MRIITDPIVDSIAFLIKRFALPPIYRLVHLVVDSVWSWVVYLVAKVAGRAIVDKASERLASVVCLP